MAVHPAELLTELLVEHHRAELTGPDEAVRDAVIVKCVSLIALAFGIPPTSEAPLDVDDAIEKLQMALAVLNAHKRMN